MRVPLLERSDGSPLVVGLVPTTLGLAGVLLLGGPILSSLFWGVEIVLRLGWGGFWADLILIFVEICAM